MKQQYKRRHVQHSLPSAMASADGEREVSFVALGAILAMYVPCLSHVSDATSKRRLVVHYNYKILLPRVGQNVPQSWQV